MKLRLALAAATCLALPLMAQAQPVTGPYVSLGVGTSIATPLNYNEKPTPGWWSGKLLSRPSYAGVAGLGYGFGNGLRIELDGNYYHNTLNKSDVTGSTGVTVDNRYRTQGGLNTYGPMVNVLYDMNVGWPVFPYVGAGVGYQWQQFAHRVNDGGGYYFSGTEGSFAYDLIAGVSYPLPFVPGLSATAEYRFMQLVQSRNYNLFATGGVHRAKIGQSSSHTFLIGLRYQLFNAPAAAPAPAPAPAPMAAPAPAPAKTYLVFFDWDKYNLTPRATQIIAQAASDSKTQNVTTLDVSGYTDTSGTAVYNQGLSERRAKAVAAQLVTDGVPASEIEIHAYGETHLLVPTGPNVREPQNRRVEIVLH
ncbi:OmpA family protein [Acidocella sp. KAb 2-4]|uniref:OmpA family protein n=1 Tax=Acidocella sp. KAb 2-4 TaxID=2885158 RepID=UPI001D093CDA|nr:OmpA family protein [Acidocella sp. KAb 2-4]MCB5943609.1 OmpA family protein [Acidocella sp. KAb 2-4]